MISISAVFNDKVRLSPHDLLWLQDHDVLETVEPLPIWARGDWLRRIPVVMRRERILRPNIVPVGVRGWSRSQRIAAYIDRRNLYRYVTPEFLAKQLKHERDPLLEHFPAIAVLQGVAPILDAAGLIWGPTGSVGYALATRIPLLRIDSDLDLLLRATAPFAQGQTDALRDAFKTTGSRIDMQVDTGYGAFSFVEWARTGSKVLLKTDVGPFITDDPWNQSGWFKQAKEILT